MEIFTYLSNFFSDPSHYIEIAILIGVAKHEKCLIKINQWIDDHAKTD